MPPPDPPDLSESGIAGAVKSQLQPLFDTITTKLDGMATAVAEAVGTTIVDTLTGAFETMAGSFFGNLKTFLHETFAQPNLPQLTPVRADAVVQQVAEAISAAESTLNSKGLVISQGTVEIDVYLKDPTGTLAAGHARLVLTVNPRV